MPTSPDDREWETHKPKLWQFWVRDKMEMKDIVCCMAKLGLDATPSQFKARFKTWGFMRHLPNETWKYVEAQMRSRKRKADEIDVIISGVYFPPAKVIKATSRNFYTQLERQNNPNPPCPPGVLVSIDPATSVPPGILSFAWGPQMPWLQFSQHLKLPETLLGSKHSSTNQFAGFPTNELDAVHRYLSTIGSNARASPSQLSMRMQALMPENFQGEHLLWSQALVEGSNIDATIRLAMSHYAYLISNNLISQTEDENRLILELVDRLNLVKVLGPRSPVLKTFTMTAILPVVFRAAIYEKRKDLLIWVLKLGLSPDVVYPGNWYDGSSSGLLDILTRERRNIQPRDRLPQYDIEMMEILLSYGASIDCEMLQIAMYTGDTRVLALLVQHATHTDSQDARFLRGLDWKALWLNAASHRSIGTGVSTLDYLIGLYKSAFPAGIDPWSSLSQPKCLIEAVEIEATGLLRVLVRNGADLNCCDEKGNFPLRATCSQNGFKDSKTETLIDTLLELGADLNYQSVSFEGTRSTTALHWAATKILGVEMVKLFLEKGADPNIQGTFVNDLSRYGLDSARNKDRSYVTETPLESAMNYHYWDCAEALLENGAIFHGDELLAVVSAAERDFTIPSSLMKALIARGFDLTKLSDVGDTVFDISIRKRFRKLAKTLADFASPEHGKRDLLRISASCGRSDSDLALLRYAQGRCNFSKGDLEMVLGQYPDAYSYEAMKQILDSLVRLLDKPGVPAGDAFWYLVAYLRRIAERSHKKPKTRPQLQHVALVIYRASVINVRFGVDILDACLPFFNQQYTGISPPPQHPPCVSFEGCESDDPCRQWPVCQKLLRAGHKPPTVSGLMMAESRHYSVENIKRHLHCGFNPRKRYLGLPTTLQLAVAKGDIALVKFLIGLGVNINAPGQLYQPQYPWNSFSERVRHNGSALQIAVRRGCLDMIHTLIEAGADINAPPYGDSGSTALQIAASSGQVGITKLLVELGADVNAPGGRCNSSTALEAAAEEGRLDTVQLLLDHGCRIAEPHRAQFVRAVKLAEWNCHEVVVSLLKRAGGWTPHDENMPFLSPDEDFGCPKCNAELLHGEDKHREDCRVTTQSVSDTRSEPSCSCESDELSDDDVPTGCAEADEPTSASQSKKSDTGLQLNDQEVDLGMVEKYTKAWLEKLERDDTVVDVTGEDLTDKDLISTSEDLTGGGEDLAGADSTGEWYLTDEYLTDKDLINTGEDLTGVDFTGADFTGEHLTYGY